MAKEKKSFFERLTGSVRIDDDTEGTDSPAEEKRIKKNSNGSSLLEDEEKDGELTVDVYQTPELIIIKTMIAGVRPEDLDISITRDMVTIRGRREEEKTVREEDYFARELYWGSFSRSIILPFDIDPDNAKASMKNGVLTIRLPRAEINPLAKR